LDYERYTIDLNAKCSCGCMEGKRVHKIYRFPNDYGASVVASPKLEGYKEGEFRVLVIHFESGPPENEYCVDRTTPITNDALDCADWMAVEDSLARIYGLLHHED